MRRLKLQPFDGVCRWCKGDIPKKRRTFCSVECVHEYKLRSNNRYMRHVVYKRDRGVCGICLVDTKCIGKLVRDDTTGNVRVEYGIPPHRKVWKRKFGGGIFDVDHIHPVQQGGGCCGLDNLRTLCLACHRAVTWMHCCPSKKNIKS